MTTLKCILSIGILTASSISGAPVVERETSYPTVIPGPNLPSLESLGLISQQLLVLSIPAFNATSVNGALLDPTCGPSEATYTNVNGLIACYHYLNALNTLLCVVPSSWGVREFCRAGDAHVTGQSVTGHEESSPCRDVASGLLWVINSCTRSDQSCAGFQAPLSNENFFVGGSHIHW